MKRLVAVAVAAVFLSVSGFAATTEMGDKSSVEFGKKGKKKGKKNISSDFGKKGKKKGKKKEIV